MDKKTGEIPRFRSYGMRKRSGISFDGTELVTKQAFKDDCDINAIMRRWDKTGQVPMAAGRVGYYGDFANAEDYHTSLCKIRNADAEFLNLPAHVRDRFENDPARLIEFLEDPENRSEAEELGIVSPGSGGSEPSEPSSSPPPGGDEDLGDSAEGDDAVKSPAPGGDDQ